MNTIITKISELKKKRNAVILAHNYELPEVQDIADYHGDSLELSRMAAKTKADIIVFCGVYFMAETASILSPHKTVLMPDSHAGCPLANMITADALRTLKTQNPNAVVVGYVNTSAEVKAELDYACTSSNAVAVIEHLKDCPEIIFVPDKHLAEYVSWKTKRTFIVWNGYCPTHVKIQPEDILKQKKLHPDAQVMVHPECRSEVVALADAVLSTSHMAAFAKTSKANEFIVGTESGMIYRLSKDNPAKKFFAASTRATCPNMKRTTLEKVLWSLEELKEEVKVPDEIRKKAQKSIDRMLSIV
jgi:quinolinate synthase